jgi:glutamyl-tRNA synthetase
VGKSAGVFDQEKMLWLNAHYIKQETNASLAEKVFPFIKAKVPDADMTPEVVKLIAMLKERGKTLVEIASLAEFYFKEEIAYDQAAVTKFFNPASRENLARLRTELQGIEFTEAAIKPIFDRIIAEKAIKMVALAQPVRIALTGGTVSPGIFEVMSILGRDRTMKRLDAALKLMEKQG